MAKYTGPVLKKCRALGISPMELGIDKNQTVRLKFPERNKATTLCNSKRNRRLNLSTAFLKNNSKCTTTRLKECAA